jgi:hypothetical protein
MNPILEQGENINLEEGEKKLCQLLGLLELGFLALSENGISFSYSEAVCLK